MSIDHYLEPSNFAAWCVVYLMATLFLLWFGLLIAACIRHRSAELQIGKTKDAGECLRTVTSGFSEVAAAGGHGSTKPDENPRDKIFHAYLASKSLTANCEIALHLRAIFEAGWNRSQLDVRSLVRNTTDHLFRCNSLLRSILSVFIILGILGTLFGLSDTLGNLSGSIRRAASFNDMLKGVQGIFETLKSAFAPSILGAFLTALGLLLMSIYTRAFAVPLTVLLERTTLTVWIPQLMPTPAQARTAVLQLEEDQAQRSVQAVEQVAKFAESFREKADGLDQAMDHADVRLRQMSETASGLQDFSQRFSTSVDRLVPYQTELKALYGQMVSESHVFQQSVQKNIAGSQEFQSQVQRQLAAQHEQLSGLLKALQSYETAYIKKREDIDEKLTVLLTQVKETFGQLSRRNDELAQAMDAGVGKPLRENLEKGLNAVQVELQRQLGDINAALLAQLNGIVQQLGRLGEPINDAARGLADTFANFSESSRQWFEKMQHEFASQNEKSQKQLQHVEVLAEHLPKLVQGLTASSQELAHTSGHAAEHGRTLEKHVIALSQDVSLLRESIVMLARQFSGGTLPPRYPPRRGAKQKQSMFRRFMNTLRGGVDDA
jgi:ABC-type transporter Mla subunit MlaD